MQRSGRRCAGNSGRLFSCKLLLGDEKKGADYDDGDDDEDEMKDVVK